MKSVNLAFLVIVFFQNKTAKYYYLCIHERCNYTGDKRCPLGYRGASRTVLHEASIMNYPKWWPMSRFSADRPLSTGG
jgi:hypothetical protein